MKPKGKEREMKLSRKTGESTKSVEQSGSIELDPSSIIRGLALSVRKRSVSKWDGLAFGGWMWISSRCGSRGGSTRFQGQVPTYMDLIP